MFGRKKKYPRWVWHSKWKLGYLFLAATVPYSRTLERTQRVYGNNATVLIDHDAAGNIVGVEVIA